MAGSSKIFGSENVPNGLRRLSVTSANSVIRVSFGSRSDGSILPDMMESETGRVECSVVLVKV